MAKDKFTKLYDLRLTSSRLSERKVSDKIVKIIANQEDYASICVSSAHVEYAGVTLGDSEIAITAMVNSDTYCEVLMLECAMAMENGADEIEMALNIAEVIEHNEEKVQSELTLIKEEIEGNAILKIDILPEKLSEGQLQRSTEVAIAAGADFVTTTGQTIETVARIIKKSTKRIGLKVKGTTGLQEREGALEAIINLLGEQYDTPELVRFDVAETDIDL